MMVRVFLYTTMKLLALVVQNLLIFLQDTKFLKKAMKSFKVDTTDKTEEIEFVLGWVYIPQLTNKIQKSHLTTTLKHVIM